jgi:phosphatidylglycerol:prolipoprotein diacylglycerol transferase
MHPILLKLGPLTLHTYGVMLASAVLLGLWLGGRRAARAGLDPELIWNLGVYAALVALIVAKLWLLAAQWDYYSRYPREIFSLSTLQSGGVFLGGFLGGLAVFLYGAWRYKLPVLKLLDVLSPSLMLGAALGRIGCFSAGCCWGKPSDVPWAVTFTNEYSSRMFGTPLHVALQPTQVYDALAAGAIFVILLWLSRRSRFPGQVFAAFCVLYGLARFTTEFFRGDPGREVTLDFPLSQAQVVCLLLIGVGAWVWWRGASRAAATHRAR